MSIELAERALTRYKKYAWLTGICGVLFLTIGIVMPFVLYSYIKSQAAQQVVMSEDNYGQWGKVPGDTGMVMQRQFVFYEWTNTEEFFVRGATPILQESQKYIYQEYQNFNDPVYNKEKDTVDFKFNQQFLPLGSTTGQELETVPNLGPLGFWYQVKQATQAQIGIQTFFGLVDGMVQQMVSSVYGGAFATLIPSQTSFNAMTTTIQSMVDIKVWLYTDPMYGFSINNAIWYDAYKEWQLPAAVPPEPAINRPINQVLATYFKISYANLEAFFKRNTVALNTAIKAASSTIDDFSSCPKGTNQGLCFAAQQWTTQKISIKAGQPSITGLNHTASGYPEISYFLKDYFPSHVSNADIYQSIVFQPAWGTIVLNYIINAPTNKDYIKTTDTLINLGNLIFLYEQGNKYDSLTAPDQEDAANECLTAIANRFSITEEYFPNVEDLKDVAFVFWKYAQYMVDIFAERKDNPLGGQAAAGLGGIAAQAMFGVVEGSMEYLPQIVIGLPLYISGMQQGLTTCEAFFTFLNDKTIPDTICSYENSPLAKMDNYSWMFLYECNIYGLSLVSCIDFNTATGAGIILKITSNAKVAALISSVDKSLYDSYQCSLGAAIKCSYYELANKQWSDSMITLNPPQLLTIALPGKFPVANSLNGWNPKLFSSPFEWGYYKKVYADMFKQDPQQLTDSQVNELLSFNKLYSSSLLSSLFISDDNFETTFFFAEPLQLQNYLRFLSALTALQLSQTRPINDLLSGYEDTFLKNIAEENPQEGGDPSTGYVLAFNDLNMTADQFQYQGMNTGAGNVDSVRQYTQVEGLSYTSIEVPYFDGFNDPSTNPPNIQSPWDGNVPIVGTDAGANQPNINEDTSLGIYITTLYQGGIIANSKIVENVYGLDTYRFQPSGCFLRSQEVCPENAKFYSYVYDYAINLTSIQQGPIFNTKTHMLSTNPPMYDRITVLNVDGNVQMPNQWDETYMLVEPISGVALKIVLNLQGVLLYEPDLLFNSITQPVMIPFFYVYRSGNLTSDQVDNVLGDLKDGLMIKDLILYIGCSIGGLLILGFAYSMYCVYKLKKALANELREGGQSEIQEKLHQADAYI